MKLSKNKKEINKSAYYFLVSLIRKKLNKRIDLEKAAILDFGCGKAKLLKQLEFHGIGESLYGVDIFKSNESLKESKKNAPNSFIESIEPYQNFNFETKFDLIIANQVFEHIDNKEMIFSQLSKKIKEGGYLLAGFPTSEILIEPHIYAPIIHWVPKRFNKLLILLSNLLKSFLLKRKEFNVKKQTSLDFSYLNTLYYEKYNWYMKKIKKYFHKIEDISDEKLFSVKKNFFSPISILKLLVSLIYPRFIRLIIIRKLFGTYLLIKK